ncbi:hypothetical protein Gorai_022580 [Gossypium raimondii]|uniref:Uncharacterized protein n=1 Tax=Gossypium raimondii TaxID=29730 RepID=A0A7J8NTU7_GOSRA|nr:hypothetical protein [Gossypium raimondii]
MVSTLVARRKHLQQLPRKMERKVKLLLRRRRRATMS